MSVVGYDVGNDTSCVALARKRGIDVIMNQESKRETPAAVSFGDKMRFIGSEAVGKMSTNPKNTVHQLKRLLGKKFKDPQVQADIARLPFKVTEGPDGGCLVHVTFCNEPATFTPQQLMAMVLVNLKKIAESEGVAVTDCVISVPTYYTESERYAMLTAATVAGVNCLRLMNDTTATALAYGIYKTDLPETDPIHVAFVDVGHESTQVSIVAFKKGQLQVKSHAWDRNLGGRDFDEVLFDHFCAEFKKKHNLDVKSNAKSSFKLRLQCEKLKKVLSANAEAPINVECLMEDYDFRSSITRETFEGLAKPILDRVLAPVQQAVAEAGVKVEDLASVEVVGCSTRVPAVYKILEDFFKQAPSRTLNAKEVVSRGCALQCAMLSPIFRVREFEVIDANPYPLVFSWDKDGETVKQVLFEKNCPVPSAKMLTFLRSEPFDVIASYGDDPSQLVGSFHVGPFKVPAGAERAKLKVKVRLNLHGLLEVDSCQALEEEEYEEPVQPAAAPAAADANGAAAPATDGPAAMEAEPTLAAAAAPAVEKKRRTKKLDVPVAAQLAASVDKSALDVLFEKECGMQASDRLQEETNERKNALEAYVYDVRSRLSDSLAPFVRQPERETLSAALSAMEDWLYDEGEDCTKSVYVDKLVQLKKLCQPLETRYYEANHRDAEAAALRRAAQSYTQVASSDGPAHAHITPAERESVLKECHAAIEWLQVKSDLQSKLSRSDDPVLVSADIIKKREMLDRVCTPIVTKPPPKKEEPKKEAPKADEPAPMDADTAAAADGKPAEAGAAPSADEAAAQPMES